MNTTSKYLSPINKQLPLFIKFRLSMNSYKLCLEKLIKISVIKDCKQKNCYKKKKIDQNRNDDVRERASNKIIRKAQLI